MSNSYSFLIGPLMAAGALGVILLMCRWAFATPGRERRPVASPVRRGDDYGLLVPVVTVPTRADAEALRSVLREAGIRATVAADADGADLLVFRQDALRARELVAG